MVRTGDNWCWTGQPEDDDRPQCQSCDRKINNDDLKDNSPKYPTLCRYCEKYAVSENITADECERRVRDEKRDAETAWANRYRGLDD